MARKKNSGPFGPFWKKWPQNGKRWPFFTFFHKKYFLALKKRGILQVYLNSYYITVVWVCLGKWQHCHPLLSPQSNFCFSVLHPPHCALCSCPLLSQSVFWGSAFVTEALHCIFKKLLGALQSETLFTVLFYTHTHRVYFFGIYFLTNYITYF